MALVTVPEEQASEDHQELLFRMAKPDVKDWSLLILSIVGLGGLAVQAYGFIFGKELWSFGTNFNLSMPLILMSLRIDRFFNFRVVMRISSGEVRLERRGLPIKQMKVKPSWISGQTLNSGSSLSSSEVMALPEEWVGGKPAKLLAALELARHGSIIRKLSQEDGKEPENPRVIEVERAVEINLDGALPIIFGALICALGFSALSKIPESRALFSVGLISFAVGSYLTIRNWRPESRVAALAYRIDGSILSGKADGQIDTLIDLAKDKLTIQYWNGLTRHSLRIGWVDQKGTFRALTHWQEKITEDISRIVTAAAAHGNLPEVVKWSAPR